jgi:predicted phosphodiesterase
MMLIMAFSDLHGDISTLKLLREKTKDDNYDCILIAGDLTNADFLKLSEAVQQVKDIFTILEGFKIPYYYVWGAPFREGNLEAVLRLIANLDQYKVEENEERLVFERDNGTHGEQITLPKSGLQKFKELNTFLDSLKFGNHLKPEKSIKLGKYLLTSSPQKVSENTIFMRHHYRRIIPEALIQLDGHLHDGQRVSNYLNLGFLYRDAFHNAQPMIGCYWNLVLNGSQVSVEFINLGGKLKEFVCPTHPEQGTFFLPFYRKRCQVCCEPEKALIKK